jgi:aminopeptidase N
VTQDYDPAAKALKLSVEQLQTIDSTSQFPQVALFQTPVEIEIGTASGTRLERVQILPKKEQSFTLMVDSKPLLVNFDYRGTLIKEMLFDKTTAELAYQLARDEDVLGRVWALNQLAGRVTAVMTAENEKQRIAAELANAVTRDKFWGVRLDAASALANVKDPSARRALIAATNDPNARVRAGAVTSLASSKDPSLATLYEKLLSDQSYGVIKAATLALGETRSAGAFEALAKLLNIPSWRDNIKVSVLSGLAALQDRRALDVAFRFAERGNPAQVRVAAVRLLGKIGGDDLKAFTVIADIATKAFASGDFNLATAVGEALVGLGDPRGLAVLEQISRNASVTPRLKDRLSQYEEQLRKAVAGSPHTRTTQP